MPQELLKGLINAFTGRGAIRVIDDADGDWSSSSMYIDDFVGALEIPSEGITAEQLDPLVAGLIADDDETPSAVSLALGDLLLEKVDGTTDANVVYGTDANGDPTLYATSLFLASPNWGGNWLVGTTYAQGKVVAYIDSEDPPVFHGLYIALRSTAGDVPTSSPLDWQLFMPAPSNGTTPDMSKTVQRIVYDGDNDEWPDRTTLPHDSVVDWANGKDDTPPPFGHPHRLAGELVYLTIVSP